MQFRVVGCDKESGEGIDMVLEAPDLGWASHMARQRGIVIDSIDPVEPPSPPSSALPKLKRTPPQSLSSGE